jgi:hypothetical protein
VGLQTEFEFTLPKGFIDRDGALHRTGTMRLATARDEIEPLRDQRVSGPDDPYLTILVIARVITELGTLPRVTPIEVEGLFAADLAFLQDLYGIINFGDAADVPALQRAVLPANEAELLADDDVDSETSPGTVTTSEAMTAPVETDVSAPRRHGRIEEVVSRAGQ